VSVLQIEGLVKHYSDADDVVRAVDGVDLSVAAGEVLALYGPSGSGKTTLLLLAAGLLIADQGRVRFMGRDLGEMSAGELAAYQRNELGFIYQSAHLIGGVPAVENAAVKLLVDGVKLSAAREIASGWLARVGLEHRLHHTPDRLSGGERARVAIARALVNEPRLILADEPTGSLDSHRGLEVLRLLSQIAREREAAIVLVTHDPQAAHVADRVLALRDGMLAEPAEWLAPGVPGGLSSLSVSQE
jgi:putative ABC transport system ATP-binding protein